ncbi:hypothetical protein B0H11DRAFT_2022664 [Mycena galericulata]|nr:hypothetical protein B0H11DRAFT_2022664 [Mycena galericulata]
MPLKLARRMARQNSGSIIQLAVSLTALTKDLADMSCFPPATALVAVLLLVMQTAQDVQANKEGCSRLARRCATILLSINDQMSGRWEYAPPSLLKNLAQFQEILESIHSFMKDAASAKWTTRFLKKVAIEASLDQYHELLDDAARSFQISTLIEIHYAMNPKSEAIPTLPEPKSAVVPPPSVIAAPRAINIQPETGPPVVAFPVPEVQSSVTIDDNAEDHILSVGVLEDQGFPRYHQSQVVLQGRSRLEDGWWSGTSEGRINGQPSLVKRYDGPREHARKKWIRDVKVLQEIYHPNLPQMIGYSVDTAPTPFILLSNVQTRSPESFLLGALRDRGVASCIENMLRFYSDIVDATYYVKQQMSLSDEQAQDFLENSSFRIDGSNSAIVGLPVLDPNAVTWRSFGLNESLRMAVLRMLPNRGLVEYRQDSVVVERDPTWQLTQLTALVSSLLPSASEAPGLPLQIKGVLSTDESYTPFLDLRQLRRLSIEANTHSHVWRKSSSIPAHKFSVGDFGYIPTGQEWATFVTLGNVLQDGLAVFNIKKQASGSQWCWKDRPIRRSDLQSFDLPDDVKCWPVAVPPGQQIDCQIVHETALTRMGDAWKFLLDNAVDLGKKWNVPPESFILITREGTDQSFHINDFKGGLQLHSRNSFPNRPGGPPHLFPWQGSIPRVMYLSTSERSDCEPCWSHTPVASSPTSALEHGWTYRISWKTGFINWTQLLPEDFQQTSRGAPNA